MAKWFSEDPEYTQISREDMEKRAKLVAIMSKHLTEMEGYSYFGSNPGIREDDLEDVAEAIMEVFDLK